MHEPFASAEQTAADDQRDTGPATLVDQILDRLDPLITRQRREVARHGCLRMVSSTQLHVLYLLDCEGTQSMTALADALGVSLPNVTGLIDRMVERGLVERIRDDSDRRVVAVRTTKVGRDTLGEMDLVRRQTMAAILELLTPDQQARALQTFSDLHDAVELIDATPDTHSTTGAGH
jgi:DNA-binding MarR family transcriptional regulator